MTGSAFITHNNTWSCSNEATVGIYSEPIYDEKGDISYIKETKTVTITGIFNASIPFSQGDKCKMAVMSDDAKIKVAFDGQVKSISQLKTVINILSKNDNISEILSNITFKF